MGGEALNPSRTPATGARWIALLAALLLGAWFGWRWSDTPVDARSGVAAVTDPDSAWRLRRTALAACTPRLAQVDGFVSFPESIGCVDLPVLDELLALAARLTLGKSLSPSPGLLDEQGLARFAAFLGPTVFGLWLLLLFGALRRGLGNSPLGSLGALLVIACAPLVVEAGRPGSLWTELFVACLLVVQVRVLLAVGRSTQALDRFTWAMVAGGVTGLGLATSPLFYLPLLAAWCAFLYAAAGAQGEERRDLVRAGLLFWLPAVVIGLVPSLGGPWVPAVEGPVSGWTEFLGDVALIGALPLVFMLWTPKGAGGEAWQPRLVFVACLALVLAALPALVFGPGHAKGAALAAALGQDISGPRVAVAFLGGPALIGVALLAATWSRRTRAVSALPWATIPSLALELIGLLALVATLFEPRALLLLALPAGDAIARWIDAGSGRRALALVPAALLWGALDPAGDGRRELQAEALATIEAARWLRENSESPGPWSSVRGGANWGVLCDGRLAPLVAWYGRRPCAAPGSRRNGDPGGLVPWQRTLSAATDEELGQRLGFEGLRYVFFSPAGRVRLRRAGASGEALGVLSSWPAVWSEDPGRPAQGLCVYRVGAD